MHPEVIGINGTVITQQLSLKMNQNWKNRTR